MPAKISIDKVEELLFIAHGDNVKLIKDSYQGMNKKATFIDKKYGEWEAVVYTVVKQGTGHPRGKADKIKKTCMEKYGVDNVSKVDVFVQKMKKELTIPSEDVSKKVLEIHGGKVILDESTYENVSSKACFIDIDYGAWWTNPYVVLQGRQHPKRALKERGEKQQIAIETMQNLLDENYANFFILDVETYKNATTVCKIKDLSFGWFEAAPRDVLFGYKNHSQRTIEKRANTNIRKYGFVNPQQNREVAIKSAKASNRSYILYHWKTDEEVVCVADYEKSTVEWLNENKTNYKWQPKVFKTPFKTKTGCYRTYRPDLFLVGENKWVEIKGYFRGISKQKWDWFHKECPNSELWDKKKLKELGIL